MGFRIHHASAALPLILILLAVIFIALTATSMITTQTTSSQQDIQQYVDDALYEITSYIQINNVYATYSKQAPYQLEKIAIFASPFFRQDIDLSTYIIQIQTESNIHLYTYNNTISPLESTGVFSQSQWDLLTNQHFGIISIQDTDQSLLSHHSFSEPSDTAAFTMQVDDLCITKGDYVTILISPGAGVEKTISFKAPLPTRTVVNLW
jgi:archaellin